MSLFRVRNPGILFDADSPAKSTAVVTGQGAPSGGSLLYGADAATKRRMMRGADPYMPGNDTTIVVGDRIYQSDAK